MNEGDLTHPQSPQLPTLELAAPAMLHPILELIGTGDRQRVLDDLVRAVVGGSNQIKHGRVLGDVQKMGIGGARDTREELLLGNADLLAVVLLDHVVEGLALKLGALQ